METTIWDTIADTPWWVGFTYVALIYSGYLATKARLVPFKYLRKTTISFVIATFIVLIVLKRFSLPALCSWLAMLILGSIIGWLQYRIMKVKANGPSGLIRLPGNWISICIIFGLIYWQSHSTSIDLFDVNFLLSQNVTRWLPPCYGLLAGLMIGKLVYLRRQW